MTEQEIRNIAFEKYPIDELTVGDKGKKLGIDANELERNAFIAGASLGSSNQGGMKEFLIDIMTRVTEATDNMVLGNHTIAYNDLGEVLQDLNAKIDESSGQSPQSDIKQALEDLDKFAILLQQEYLNHIGAGDIELARTLDVVLKDYHNRYKK